ncbi:MAG TPA: polyphosphate kinase 2 family protein [Candidatus Krumholzibacteria bacterium]|nr:polyphosphate kinase 2 family protein [Candidatus Krumholzibacteria bacterium]
MKNAKFIQIARKLSRPYRVTDGAKFRLRDVDPGDTGSFAAAEKPRAREALELGVAILAEMQDRLYAQNQWSVLLIFQAMDAAGKDSAIKHVMTGVNPQGCDVTSFKVPSTEELDHDFMWRCARRLPERGKIGIFNRSYYEETLVVRVHPELILDERVPGLQAGDKLWEQRFGDIRHFERYLAHNGTVVRKFFLHVSRDEQKRRFLARLDDPEKNWKFSSADVRERGYWKEYMAAYEDAIRATATPDAPWYVVPADNKWFTRIVLSSAIIDTLSSLDLEYPKVTGAKLKDFAAAKKALLAETRARR